MPRPRPSTPRPSAATPQFAQFYRSLEAYKASFNKKGDVMVVDPASSEFFKAFRGSGARRPRRRRSRPWTATPSGSALALVLVFEGLFPFVSPAGWRRTFQRLLELQDGQLRFFGLCSILVGLAAALAGVLSD